MTDTIILHNRLKLDEYKVYKSYVAGIVLKPAEVKSIIKGSCSLRGAYAYLYDGVMTIMKMYIPDTGYQNRPILLKKSEIKRIAAELTEGKVLIPKVVFKRNNLIKLELMLCTKLPTYQSKRAEKIRQIQRQEAKHYNVHKIKI